MRDQTFWPLAGEYNVLNKKNKMLSLAEICLPRVNTSRWNQCPASMRLGQRSAMRQNAAPHCKMSVAKGTLLAPLHAFSVNEGQKFQLLPEPMYCAVSREFRQNSTPSMLRARALPTGIYAILQWGGRKKIVFVSKQAPQPPSNSWLTAIII